MASVVLRNLTKQYSGNSAPSLEMLNLEIDDGEFVCLVGPSGCGKTTALRMIAGLEDITSGEIEIGGRVVNDLPSRDRDIALVFQSYALYPHLTVADNMSFGLKLRKVPKDKIEEAVQSAAKILDLGNCWTVSRPNSRVASVNAWPSGARWCVIRPCS
jgi:multiple sugar transport system ATP-binding protein